MHIDIGTHEYNDRVPTGIEGLDTILHGGLIKGSVYIVQGSPGGGKTIFSNNICFRHAARGGRCVYFTLLSESHDRLIRHMRQLDFFEESSIPESVYYESVFDVFEGKGLDGVLRLLSSESRARNADLVVLDGLFVIEERVASEAIFRRFINDLAALAHIAGTTMLLLTNSRRTPSSPEYTMVDGWIELGYMQPDFRVIRFLQVHKIRGSNFIAGQHTMTISEKGITVYPRLESVVSEPWPTRKEGKISSGIPDLDAMLHGGIVGGATTMVIGPTGVGKTCLGLNFIQQCSEEEPGLIFGFYENESDCASKAASIGLDLYSLFEKGIVVMQWHPPVETTLDQLAYELLHAVRARKVKRVLVDGIEAFAQAVYPERVGRFLTALTGQLRAEGATTVFTLEIKELTGGEVRNRFVPVSAVAENIVLLRYVEHASENYRSICIMKARNSSFDSGIRKLLITPTGLRLDGSFGKAEDILTGHAHSPNTGDTGDQA